MDATPKTSLIPAEYRDILPPAAVRAIGIRLLHMDPEDREDALQEAVLSHLGGGSPSAAVKILAEREELHRTREPSFTKLYHP